MLYLWHQRYFATPCNGILFSLLSGSALRSAAYYRGVRGCSIVPKIWSSHFGMIWKKILFGKSMQIRNFRFFKMQIFKNRKIFGEKIEKSKIASDNFKLLPWATQSPNMSFQLPLGPKIIAAPCWGPDFLEVPRVLDHFQWDSHWKWLRFSRESQISSDFCSGDGAAIIFGHRRS